MSRLETNIFPIANLADLTARYELYRIRGLALGKHEYDHNAQILIGKLSRTLRAPVAILPVDDEPHLAVPAGTTRPESPLQLVRATAHFDRTDRIILLDYENPTLSSEALCIRFLQFAIQGAFYDQSGFWQPAAGQPFFEREPFFQKDGVSVYRGYVVRVVAVADCKFGVCVDVTFKYVSSNPLPARVSREHFRQYKNSRCIYHYGLGWYEIRLHDHTGLSLNELMIEDGVEGCISLHEFIMKKARKPFRSDVAQLAPDGAALSYLTPRKEVRHAAAALCYPVYDTSDPRIQPIHRGTILSPTGRRNMIHAFVQTYLREVVKGTTVVRVADQPVSVPEDLIQAPDLAFGNDTVLSVRGAPGTTPVSIGRLGTERLAALYNDRIGPYTRKPLDVQYFVVPKSIWERQGRGFLNELKREVNKVYPQETSYDPIVIPYNDVAAKTFTAQGKAILDAIDAAQLRPGFGIVMIHETERRIRKHDQLASMLMHKLRLRDLYMTVIHTTMAIESYRQVENGGPNTAYEVKPERRGRLQGYLRNVALNKVLLANERWAFVLATPLNADITIAIDVKGHTACFTFFGKSGPDIRTEITTSQEKEKLRKGHVRNVILKVLREDDMLALKKIETIVVLRDGLLFGDEVNGAREALDVLQKEGRLSGTTTMSFVEVPKKSVVPFRLFDVETSPDGSKHVQNPRVGSSFRLNVRDGYVCSTGREFTHPGTANPLQVKLVAGTMPLRALLEDVYAQTCLALTRPEDCSRLPFSLKLTDIRLNEHAGIYDEDALAFGDEGEDETETPSGVQEAEIHE